MLFFAILPNLSGQSDGEIVVRLESSPERPVLDGSWRITILVDHPVPEDVTVIPPDLPVSLTFAQSRKETRLVRGPSGEGRRWTLVEFLFVPHRIGNIRLGAFEVSVQGRRIWTQEPEAYVSAQDGAREAYRPRLAWDTLPAVLGIGESAELSLRVIDWDPGKALLPQPLRATAPAEALLEELPLTNADLDQRRVLRLRVTPLEGARVTLGPFPLRLGALSLEAPAVTIRLRPPAPTAAPATDSIPGNAAFADYSAVPAPDSIAVTPIPPPFPGTGPSGKAAPLPLFRRAYDDTLSKAGELWAEARYAEALAELRRGERDLLSGPNLATPRRAAEQALGLSPTADEKWRPRNLFFALIALSFSLLVLVIWLPLRPPKGGKRGERRVTSLFFRGYKLVVFVLVAALGLGIVGLAPYHKGLETGAQGPGAGSGGGRSSGSAVALHSCAAYRVPDAQGAVSARWTEGQPVKVRAVADFWAYAESPDGDAGWVHQDNLLLY